MEPQVIKRINNLSLEDREFTPHPQIDLKALQMLAGYWAYESSESEKKYDQLNVEYRKYIVENGIIRRYYELNQMYTRGKMVEVVPEVDLRCYITSITTQKDVKAKEMPNKNPGNKSFMID